MEQRSKTYVIKTAMKAICKAKAVLYTDLAIVSMWAICAMWTGRMLQILVPLILLRLAMSFSLYRRERNAVWLIGVEAAIVLLSMAHYFRGTFDFVIEPYAKFYDVANGVLTGENLLMRSFVQWIHSGSDYVAAPSVFAWIVVSVLSAWLLVAPIVIFGLLLWRKALRKLKWNWRRIRLAALLYVGCVLIPFALPLATYDSPYNAETLSRLWQSVRNHIRPDDVWFVLTVMWGIWLYRTGRVRCEVKNYIKVMLLVAIALMSGRYMLKWIDLFAMALTSCLLIKWIFGKGKKRLWLLYVPIVFADYVFWLCQRSHLDVKIILLAIAGALFVGICASYAWGVEGRWRAISLFVWISIVFPSLSLGFNPFACLDSRISQGWDNVNGYVYSPRGLLYMQGCDGVGIRDRYGWVMPPKYGFVRILDPRKPYFALMEGDEKGAYDIERQSLVVKPGYKDICPTDDKLIWELVRFDNLPSDYFVMPDYYNRCYRYECYISHDNMRHCLGDYPLHYAPEAVSYPEETDKLLADMMTFIWHHDEGKNVTIAESEWRWMQYVNSRIYDRLTIWEEVAGDTTDVYTAAMNEVVAYTGDGYGSTMPEINCSSYVKATVQRYLTLRRFAQMVAYSPDSMAMMHEYHVWREFNDEYLTFLSDARRDAHGYHSGDSEESNSLDIRRKELDMERIDQLCSLFLVNKPIAVNGSRPSTAEISERFHKANPCFYRIALAEGEPEPTYRINTICQSFIRWVALRDSIADILPPAMRISYRNHTTNIINETVQSLSLNNSTSL